jgi:hypothetical protein
MTPSNLNGKLKRLTATSRKRFGDCVKLRLNAQPEIISGKDNEKCTSIRPFYVIMLLNLNFITSQKTCDI